METGAYVVLAAVASLTFDIYMSTLLAVGACQKGHNHKYGLHNSKNTLASKHMLNTLYVQNDYHQVKMAIIMKIADRELHHVGL